MGMAQPVAAKDFGSEQKAVDGSGNNGPTINNICVRYGQHT